MALEHGTTPAALTPEKTHMLLDRVLVEVEEGAEKSTGGIFMPDTVRSKEAQSSICGVVLRVGPGKKDEKTGQLVPMGVKVGDRVLFNTYAGTRAVMRNKNVRIFNQPEILAYIDP